MASTSSIMATTANMMPDTRMVLLMDAVFFSFSTSAHSSAISDISERYSRVSEKVMQNCSQLPSPVFTL